MANFPALWSRDMQQNPFRAMTRLQRQIDRIFDDFMTPGVSAEFPAFPEAVFQPPCDVQETESHYLLSFDLPGMSRNDVKIEMSDNVLHVYGERRDERQKEKGAHHRGERFHGVFERLMTLPANVKAEGVEAQFENGVLHVAIPKAEASKARQIQIGEGRSGIFSKLLSRKDEKAA